MIKSKDLRIGNYVFDNMGGLLKIEGISDVSLTGHLLPIPITLEWLNRFHIKNTDDPNKFIHHWKGFYFKLEKVGNGYFLKSSAGTVESKPLNYVHQVQNLYHALTGVELELKPE